jgi:hypothetical protein
MINIDYPLDLVALVRYRDEWIWFVSEREYWILDIKKYKRAYKRVGVTAPWASALEIRRDLEVVDCEQAPQFLELMKGKRVQAKDLQAELKARLSAAESLSDICEWLPAIFVDFDRRTFVSYYPEPFSFEEYVPDSWEGRYAKFHELVPNEQRYWLEDGSDLVGLLT